MVRYREYMATKHDYYARNPKIPRPAPVVSEKGGEEQSDKALRSAFFRQRTRFTKKTAERRLDGF